MRGIKRKEKENGKDHNDVRDCVHIGTRWELFLTSGFAAKPSNQAALLLKQTPKGSNHQRKNRSIWAIFLFLFAYMQKKQYLCARKGF